MDQRKKPNQSRRLTWMFLLGAVVIAGVVILVVFVNRKEKEEGPAPVPTITQGPVTPEPTPQISATPIPSPELVTTPLPTQEPSVTELPDLLLSEEDAAKKVSAAIGDDSYKPILSDDHLNVEGKEYYAFVIVQEDKELTPMILVSKDGGNLHFYDTDGNLSEFTKFPLDKVETVPSTGAEITKDQALELLSKVPQKDLGLARPFSEYTVLIDDWTTVVNGESCFCFNVFEGKGDTTHLAAMYYVATDGVNIYKLNEEENIFIRITK